MATQYTNPQLKRLIDVNFAYPKNEPISALEARQVFYALVDSVALLADGGFKTKLPTWTLTPPAVPNLFAKDEPVIVSGVLYRAKRAIADSRNAPGSYTGWQDDWEAVGGGSSSAADKFTGPFTFSLDLGETFGKYRDGMTAPWTGFTAVEAIQDAGIKTKLPTYSPATISASQSAPADGEIGESVDNTVTGNFAKNDAGNLLALRAYRVNNGTPAQIGSASTTSPISRTATGIIRSATPVGFYVVADYAAGVPKNITPGNTPDTRAAKVRATDAPQAAEVGFQSNVIYITGTQPWFYGTSDTDSIPNIYSGNKVIAGSGGSITIPSFGSGTKYLWFAVPRNANGTQQKLFTTWFRSALDNGSIGGATNLFRSPTLQNVSSVGLAANWNRDYDLYFTNYQTEAGTATTLN
jgi:hypothetical protein